MAFGILQKNRMDDFGFINSQKSGVIQFQTQVIGCYERLIADCDFSSCITFIVEWDKYNEFPDCLMMGSRR